jgi:hypothetical protein
MKPWLLDAAIIALAVLGFLWMMKENRDVQPKPSPYPIEVPGR